MLGLGFAGLLLILRPGTGVFEPAALVGLASAVLASIAQVGIRRLTRTEPVTRIVFYFGLVASVVSLPPAVYWWKSPSPATWAVLLLMGVFATVGQLTLTRAYVHAPAASVGPFLYAGPVFAGLLDWLHLGPPARPAVRPGRRDRRGRRHARAAPAAAGARPTAAASRAVPDTAARGRPLRREGRFAAPVSSRSALSTIVVAASAVPRAPAACRRPRS